MGDREDFERYAPEHPLPEGIQQMNRQETVCQYCGVSYLIHNEIKALEDKLRAAEKELAHYRGREGREEKLKEELSKAEEAMDQYRQTIVGKDAVMGTLTADIKRQEDELVRLTQAKSETEERLAYMTQVTQQYRSKQSMLQSGLSSVLTAVRQNKTEMSGLQDLVRSRDQVFTDHCHTVQQQVKEATAKLSNESSEAESRLGELELASEALRSKNNSLQRRLRDTEMVMEGLKTSEQKSTAMLKDLAEYKARTQGSLLDVQRQLDDEISRGRTLRLESQQYQEQLKKLSQELEHAQSKVKASEQAVEQNTARLENEVKEKANVIQTLERELSGMKRRQEEQQRTEDEIQRRASASHRTTQDLKEALQRAKADCEALKKEREMLISAHQDQIEQLRESFKNRLAEVEKWPEKLEQALQKERLKHNREVTALEAKLKENFVLEMQIERQKHQELVEKYLSESKQEADSLRNQLNSYKSQQKSEVSELHKQIAELKARGRETENTLRAEIASLKKIIRDLENRLGRFDVGSEGKVTELKSQLVEVQHELAQVSSDNKKLDTALNTAKEEIQFLQDTVRRECEERFELTEALSDAREELLAIKKPPGGYGSQSSSRRSSGNMLLQGGATSSTPRPDSPRSIKSSSSSSTIHQSQNSSNQTSQSRSGANLPSQSRASVASRNEEIALFKRISSRQPHPPGQTKTVEQDLANSPSVTVGYEGDRAKTPSKGLKGASLSEQRKRIAQAVGRR